MANHQALPLIDPPPFYVIYEHSQIYHDLSNSVASQIEQFDCPLSISWLLKAFWSFHVKISSKLSLEALKIIYCLN